MRTIQNKWLVFSALTAYIHLALFLQFVEVILQLIQSFAQMGFIQAIASYFYEDCLHSVVDHLLK